MATHDIDRHDIENDPRIFIEELGYSIGRSPVQPGGWVWTAPSDESGVSFATAGEALESAWDDAVAQAAPIMEISCEAWGQMSFLQQREAVTFALSGEALSVKEPPYVAPSSLVLNDRKTPLQVAADSAAVIYCVRHELPPPIRRLEAVSRRLRRFGQFLAALQCSQCPAQHHARCR